MRKYQYWLVVMVVAVFLAVCLVWANSLQPQIYQPVAQKEKTTPAPSAEAVGNNFEEVLATYVIDGDTIILQDGRHVRYIGIDTPELGSGENKKTADYNITAIEARKFNQQLVLGKKVILEKDVEEFDKYGRTLAYVWVDGKMVNEELLKAGVAVLMTIEPNIRYEERLRVATGATNF
ncbi:MAG: thermonuclease family protein [bacterium]|nr:thermonuclease family protein [bacterium]